jgi:hypothetical protein
MIPTLKNCQNPISISYFFTTSITIRLATAPIMVAFPASVAADANESHNKSLDADFRIGSIKIVYGTLLTICESTRLSPCKLMIPVRLLLTGVFSINRFRTPTFSIPCTTINNPAKNKSKTQSTSLITFEGFIFPRINISEAPSYAISGIDKLRVWLKKNSIIIPRNIGTENFID